MPSILSIPHPVSDQPVSNTGTRQLWLNWEDWPLSFYQFPMGIVWLWYCLRSGSWWFFSSSNPTIEFGGFEGEGKQEMYAQLPAEYIPMTIFIEPDWSVQQVLKLAEQHQFQYPFAVKPDIGMKGLLFRKMTNADDLAAYHQACPVRYMIQEWVDLPVELSVFYYRHPNSNQGTIAGMTWKEYIEVRGNGKSTLLELMEASPRTTAYMDTLKIKHQHHLEQVIPVGHTVQLTYTGNRQSGARLHNLNHEIDHRLTAVFDQLSLYSGHFYWGRFDLKCRSIEALKQGRDFKILEFNGAGAGPNHIYHTELSFSEAWQEVQRCWAALFEISRFNHQQGIQYWTFRQGWQYLKKARHHFRLLERLEKQIP